MTHSTSIPNKHFVLFQQGANPMFSYNQLRKLASEEYSILTPNPDGDYPDGDDAYLAMSWDEWQQADCPMICQIMEAPQ